MGLERKWRVYRYFEFPKTRNGAFGGIQGLCCRIHPKESDPLDLRGDERRWQDLGDCGLAMAGRGRGDSCRIYGMEASEPFLGELDLVFLRRCLLRRRHLNVGDRRLERVLEEVLS